MQGLPRVQRRGPSRRTAAWRIAWGCAAGAACRCSTEAMVVAAAAAATPQAPSQMTKVTLHVHVWLIPNQPQQYRLWNLQQLPYVEDVYSKCRLPDNLPEHGEPLPRCKSSGDKENQCFDRQLPLTRFGSWPCQYVLLVSTAMANRQSLHKADSSACPFHHGKAMHSSTR